VEPARRTTRRWAAASCCGTARASHGSLLAAAILVLLPGCGAKTGLEVPDAPFDGGPDAGTDAPDVGTDAPLPCVELSPDAGPIDLPLDTEVVVGRADVLMLVDTTASMSSEIEQIRRGLRDTIVPGIRDAIPDSRLGVAVHADFPNGSCGGPGDSPFDLVLPIEEDVARVQAAVDAIEISAGGDPPESQVEGLYQVATGEGLPGYVEPSFGCPGGGFGYPCFRTDALPVVLLFTDAPFHAGPGGSNPYPADCDAEGAHTYEEARAALVSRGVRVMGLFSGRGDGRSDLERIARDTGAVSGDGPIVFDIGERGESLSRSVVEAVRTLADVIEFDVDTVLADPAPGDGVDVRDFVDEVIALRAEPMSGVGAIEGGVFRRVQTGTRVVFQLRLRNDVVAPGTGPQRFLLEIVFRADGRTRLGSTLVELVVPGRDGSGCGG
jgi:hypothetical protein